MSKKMYANFSDKAYCDFMSGAAVDNNGLRSPKGSYYPDQPSFEPINERNEQLKDAGVQMLIAAGGVLVFEVVLPEVKRFTNEKLYPYVAEKWDKWQEKRHEKKAEKQNVKIEQENSPVDDGSINTDSPTKCRILKFDDYKKMA